MNIQKLCILCLGLVSFISWANKEDLSQVEKIQVTGSRIKRINIEGPSPLLVINKKDLENSGYNSVADVLRDTTISPFGLGRETAGSSIAGESFAAVHSQKTLVLINGQRVVEDPNAEAVDLHLIPIAAVERVEIIKDGSSALYGSDALGGVINFIMKSDFTGVEASGRVAPTAYPIYKGGSRAEGSIVWGQNYAKGSMTGVLQGRFNHGILSSDRVWSTDRISPTSVHPVFYPDAGGNPVVSPACPPEYRQEIKNVIVGCNFNYAHLLHTLPSISQISGYLQADYKSEGIEYYAQILPSFKNTHYIFPPLPAGVSLKAGHKLSVGGGQAGTLVYRFESLGNRILDTRTFAVDSSFGAKGYLSSTWDWNLSFKTSAIIKNDHSKGLLLGKETVSIISQGLFDPFKSPEFDMEAIEANNLDSPFYTTKNLNSSYFLLSDLVFTGSLGIFDAAVGAQVFRNSYIEKADPRSNHLLSPASSSGGGYRNIYSSFAEASYAPTDKLELQLAGRVDQYQDIFLVNDKKDEGEEEKNPETYSKFRFTANPKFAFRYQPANNFLIRGSIGTSFIAPTLHQLHSKPDGNQGYPTITDYVACFNEVKGKGLVTSSISDDLLKRFLTDQKETIAEKDLPENQKTLLTSLAEKLVDTTYCKGRQYLAHYKGNKDLKETKGLSASISSVMQFNDDLSLIVDLWYIATNESISDGINNDLTKVELLKGKDFVEQNNVTINRETTGYNAIYNAKKNNNHGIYTKLLNTGRTKISGLDFSLSAHFSKYKYKGGNFYFKNDGVIALYAQEEGFPGRTLKNNIGKSGLPRWKNIASLGWTDKKHDLTLKVHSIGSTSKQVNELDSLGSYHRLDLSYVWNKDAKTIFNFGLVNALFTTPPRDETIATTSQINEAIHEVRGAYVYAGMKKTF